MPREEVNGRGKLWAQRVRLSTEARGEVARLTNHLALIVGRFSSSGLGFVAWMLVARLYPTAEVGIASGVISAMMLCVQVALLGVGAAVISLFPQHQLRPGRLLNTALNLVMGTSLVAGLLFVALASTFFRELSVVTSHLPYLLLFLGVTLFGAVNVLQDHVSIAVSQGGQVLVRNVLHGGIIIVAVGAVPFLTGADSSSAIVFSWTLGGLAACALGIVQLSRSLPEYRYQLAAKQELGVELIRVGLPNYLLSLTERAPNWIIPIAIAELLSPVDNAHWYAAWMMAWVVFIVPMSIGQNLFAEISKNPSAYRTPVRRALKASLVLGVAACVGAIALAPLFLTLLGESYAFAGATPLRILALAVFPVAMVQAFYAVCRGTHRLGEATLIGLMSGVAGVTGAIAAGLAYGLIGVAVAWLAVQMVTAAWAAFRLFSPSQWHKRAVTLDADGSERISTKLKPPARADEPGPSAEPRPPQFR